MATLSEPEFIRRTLIVLGLTVATILLASLFVLAVNVFLVLFAGILIAVLLRAPTDWLTRHTLVRHGAALATVGVAAACLIGLIIWLYAAPMAEQLAQLSETLPDAFAMLGKRIQEYPWARSLLSHMDSLWRSPINLEVIGRATGLISSTVNVLIAVVVALFLGFYLAAQPRLYQRGFVRLLPYSARPKGLRVLNKIGHMLQWWLMGRLLTMLLVGTAAGLGLWWLDIPLAFALGLLAGILEFVPYLGPFVGAVAPLLIAFNVDAPHAFYVLLLFLAIQTAENYLFSPLIEQRTVSLPPALVIFSTLLLGVLFGTLGIALSSPLTATCLIAVKLLYVEDVIEGNGHVA
ncbi:MAG: AI-2E family transporter [Pseudomonadota bacterium]